MIKVLVDGWPLCRQPNSPQALHLWGLLNHKPQDVEFLLACPQEPPESLPDGTRSTIELVGESAWDLLRWQQRILNRLSGEENADLLYLSQSTPPLVRKTPVIIAEAGYGGVSRRPGTFLQRLVFALAEGGQQRGQSWLIPPAWTVNVKPGRAISLSPFVHSMFLEEGAQAKLELPERYVLYHGDSSEESMLHLMDAWSWVVGSLGDSVALILVDVDDKGEEWLESFMMRYQLDLPIQVMNRQSLEELSVLYQQADALIYTDKPKPWGSPVVHAIFNSVPVIGYESPELDTLIGQAGILVAQKDARKLGASILTVLVNPEVQMELSNAASRRRASWLEQETTVRMGEIFKQIIEKQRESIYPG